MTNVSYIYNLLDWYPYLRFVLHNAMFVPCMPARGSAGLHLQYPYDAKYVLTWYLHSSVRFVLFEVVLMVLSQERYQVTPNSMYVTII
jgi:hypothetical protein